MPTVVLYDLDDPRIAIYRRLKATNQTRDSGQFVVEGEKLFDVLRTCRFPMTSVLVPEREAPRFEPRVPFDIPLYVLPRQLISELVGYGFHQGVLASGQRQPWPILDHLLPPAGQAATLIVCPQIDNPENLGAIVRLGDVFGVDAVLVGPRCPDPLSRRVLRVSMGMSLQLPVIARDDLATDVERLRTQWGFERLATVTGPDATPLDSVKRPERLLLMFGSESAGLATEWVERCDGRITIPMRPGAESLNLAIAAGIVLYHLTSRSREVTTNPGVGECYATSPEPDG